MLPIKLEGNSLGERHKQINTLVNQVFENTEIRHLYKDFDEVADGDRLFKIELADKCRDVDFILATLKSDDILYVSRALKATWLITDDEYSNIINPEHLYTVLFPQMHNKAVCKLKFKIRQHLRSEERCEVFYKYFSNDLNDINGSVEFLPYCSKDFILRAINECDIFNNGKIVEVKDKLFKRITERFSDMAEPILRKVSERSAQELISVLNYVAISQTDHYLYLLEKYGGKYSNLPKFTKHLSTKIAKRFPRKLYDHLDIYLIRIDLCCVAKAWQKKNIEEFMDVIAKSEAPEVRRWFSEWTISKLLSEMTKEEKQVIITKYFHIEEPIKENRDQYIYESNFGNTYISPSKLHKWYERISFDTTFTEIKQLIRATKSPEDRSTLLIELSVLAGEDPGYLKLVLHHYFTAHMNEQKINKIHFLDQLVKTKKVYLFDEETWKFVNDLFISLETYGNENYSNYNEVIVFHDILNHREVPDVIMEKYECNRHSKESLKRLTDEQKLQIYNYLIAYFESKCINKRVQEGISRENYNSICILINNFIDIVNLWDKCVLDYPTIIHGITDLILYQPVNVHCSYHFYVNVVCFNLLNGLPIPHVIMDKYLKIGYSNNIPNLSDENKVKTFDHLVIDFIKRTSNALTGQVNELVISLTTSFISFLYSSEKSLAEFPHLITLMKHIVVAVPDSLNYPSQRAARRLLFDVSLFMSQSEDVLIDIIKHDTTVLSRHYNNFENLMIAKKKIYRRLLRKLRAYFDDDYAALFRNSFKTQLKNCEKPSTETKYVEYVNANLSFVCKKQTYSEVIQEYLPKNHKVEWGEEDISIINIRKYIAKNLRHVRPPLDIDIIYEFAKGDYLQYALPSLLSICMDAPSANFAEKILPNLLNSPVSVQKHGIRIAFFKLRLDQVKPILEKLWSKSKNVSIRNAIFESTLTLLNEQVKDDSIQILWQLIKSFITNLQEDEERTLLLYFNDRLNSLPSRQVRCESYQISYREMERIKDKIDWDKIRNCLLSNMCQLLSDGMDLKFVSTILLENFNKLFFTDYFYVDCNSIEFRDLLVEYILLGNGEQQSNHYESVARPIFDAIKENWNKSYKEGNGQTFFKYILESLSCSSRWRLEVGKQKTLVFNNLFEQFKILCNIKEYFAYHMNMKLLITLNEAMQVTDFSKDKQEAIKSWSFFFSKNCVDVLNEAVNSNFPSIALSFRRVLHQFITNITSQWNYHHKIIFSLAFVDNVVREDSLPHNYLVGLYMYDQIEVDLEFEQKSGDYHSHVTSRIMAIKNEEIKFHMATKLL